MAGNQFLSAVWGEQTKRAWSNRRLATELGVAESTISYLKRGLREPGLDFIESVLRVFPELVGYLVPRRSSDGAASSRTEAPAEVGRGPPGRRS